MVERDRPTEAGAMSEILLLGPGKNRSRLLGRPFTGDTDNLWVIEKNDNYRRNWDDARYIVGDLNDPCSIALPHNHFDEVHGYEIFNLLPGDPADFFDLWGEIYDWLSPAGQVIGSTPNWKSRFIHAYPGQQRVYTPELLAYLDQDSVLNAKEDFSEFWPKPYCFKSIFMADSTDGDAFYFRLVKC